MLFYFLLILPLFLIAFSTDRLVWDELYHVGFAKTLFYEGLSFKTLQETNLAMGPLYSFIIASIFFVTGNTDLPIQLFRGVTYFCYVGILWVFFRIFCDLQVKKKETLRLIMAIPIISLMSVFAMTDIPTLFMFCLSIYFFGRSVEESKSPSKSITNSLIAGLFCGLCIIGRQTYLVSLSGVFWMFYKCGSYRKPILLFLLAAFPIPFSLFYVWRGITPPLLATERPVSSTLSSTHFLLALSQSALTFYFVYPNRLLNKWRTTLLVVFLLCLATPLFDQYLVLDLAERLPLRFFFQKLLGPWHFPVARHLVVGSFAIGFIFMAEIVSQFLKSKKIAQQALLICGFSLIAYPLFVAFNYSSRYPMAGILILVLSFSQVDEAHLYWKRMRFFIGYGLALVVAAYYLEVPNFF